MGGKQSRSKATSSRALFSVRSASLDSISTAVSLRTAASTAIPPHSPSMDTINKYTKPNGTTTTKDEKGNTYILLETASTDCNSLSAPLAVERRSEKGGEDIGSNLERGSEKVVCHQGEMKEAESSGIASTNENKSVSLTTSLPTEGERSAPMAAEGITTSTATEMAKIKDSKQTNSNKSKLVQRVLPTRSHSKAEKHTSVPNNTEMEREVQQLLKSMLKQPKQVSDDGHSHSQDTSSTTQLPEALLQCSHKELNHLASYICHTIKDTLQSSLVEQAITAQQQQQQQQQKSAERTTELTGSTKRVQINEEPVSFQKATEGSESPHNCGGMGSGGRTGRVTEDRYRRRHKRPRRERPVSTPGAYWKDELSLSDPQSHGLMHHASPSPPNEHQSQTHSNEESCSHRSSVEYYPETSRRRATCRACREHSRNCHTSNVNHLHNGARKKRVGRSKDTPVDVSLDDNCPGVDLIRRRYTHHHHTVCENCLQTIGKGSVSRQGRHRPKHPHSTEIPNDTDLQLSPDDQMARGIGEGSGFITLYQLRTVAEALKGNSGHVDHNLPKHEKTQRKSFGPPKSQSFRHKRGHQYHMESKQKSSAIDDCVSVTSKEPSQPLEEHESMASPSTPEELGHFQELVYPMKPRSGRDSPATDMAVIDLSVDSPCMLQPLDKDLHSNTTTSYTICDNNSPNKIMHLHHHYHHIIHHGEP